MFESLKVTSCRPLPVEVTCTTASTAGHGHASQQDSLLPVSVTQINARVAACPCTPVESAALAPMPSSSFHHEECSADAAGSTSECTIITTPSVNVSSQKVNNEKISKQS